MKIGLNLLKRCLVSSPFNHFQLYLRPDMATSPAAPQKAPLVKVAVLGDAGYVVYFDSKARRAPIISEPFLLLVPRLRN